MAQTNNLHHLIWRGFEYHGKIFPIRGPANWMAFIYAYGLTIANLVVFVWLFLRSSQHRWPVVIMSTGMVAGRVPLPLKKNAYNRVSPHIYIYIGPRKAIPNAQFYEMDC